MKKGICLMATAAIRLQPDHRSEMVSQLLFGECATIQESNNEWFNIETCYDKYHGWVAQNQLFVLNNDEDKTFIDLSKKLVTASSMAQISDERSGLTFSISAGSSFYANADQRMVIAEKCFHYDGGFAQLQKAAATCIPEYATSFANASYLWGGRSVFGLDCSGFTQIVFKMAGKIIPRDSAMQATVGEPVHLIHESLPGDLAFFDNDEGIITHVGIILENNTIIHAHGQVRTDKIDHHGIFNTKFRQYSHRLRLIKRIIF